jgi:hypothetical protein
MYVHCVVQLLVKVVKNGTIKPNKSRQPKSATTLPNTVETWTTWPLKIKQKWWSVVRLHTLCYFPISHEHDTTHSPKLFRNIPKDMNKLPRYPSWQHLGDPPVLQFGDLNSLQNRSETTSYDSLDFGIAPMRFIKFWMYRGGENDDHLIHFAPFCYQASKKIPTKSPTRLPRAHKTPPDNDFHRFSSLQITILFVLNTLWTPIPVLFHSASTYQPHNRNNATTHQPHYQNDALVHANQLSTALDFYFSFKEKETPTTKGNRAQGKKRTHGQQADDQADAKKRRRAKGTEESTKANQKRGRKPKQNETTP